MNCGRLKYFCVVSHCNGNTISSPKNYLVLAQAKSWSLLTTPVVFDSHIVLKNGNVVLSSKPLASYSSWIGSYTGTGTKRFTLDFENLNISLAEGAAVKNVFEMNPAASHTNDLDAEYDVTFRDCSFDFTNAASEVTIFSATHTDIPADISVNVTMSGGSIKANEAENVNVSSISDGANASLAWETGEASLYITLILPEAAAAPEGTVDVNGVNMVCTAYKTTDDGSVVYRLVPTGFEVLGYDAQTKSAEIAIEKEGTYVVIFAKYEGDTLSGIDMVNQTLKAGVHTVSQTADKIMLWQDMGSVIPLCVGLVN